MGQWGRGGRKPVLGIPAAGVALFFKRCAGQCLPCRCHATLPTRLALKEPRLSKHGCPEEVARWSLLWVWEALAGGVNGRSEEGGAARRGNAAAGRQARWAGRRAEIRAAAAAAASSASPSQGPNPDASSNQR